MNTSEALRYYEMRGKYLAKIAGQTMEQWLRLTLIGVVAKVEASRQATT